MAEKLGPSTPVPVRMWLLKQLERIGRSECVDAMAPVVTDGEKLVRNAAIRASRTTRLRRPVRQASRGAQEGGG